MTSAQSSTAVDTTSRLAALRELMAKRNIHVYVVPSEDAHQSEYICAADARRGYISGFTGSAGSAIITPTEAALFTDGRYFLQAGKQLDKNWTLMKQGLPKVPTWQEWTLTQAKGGKNVGVDATLITQPDAKKLQKDLETNEGGELLGLKENLVDQIWGKSRPARPDENVRVLEKQFSGKSTADKLVELREALDKKKASAMVVSMLDDIAWLFNLRGSDIPYNPVFFAYALVTQESAKLYINSTKLTDKVIAHLGKDVSIASYDSIFTDCLTFGQKLTLESAEKEKKKVLLASKGSWALAKSLGEDNLIIERSPITDTKAIKNKTEMEGMRQCHIRDGASLISYFAWLEDYLKKGNKIDEVEAADKLEKIRSEKEHFAGLSFDTISATGPNGAIIHYGPKKETCAVIDPKAIYLCDSGAQYLDGTTDTTRTLSFATPTSQQKKAYTLVLKGHIAISRTVFPKGTTGYMIDVLARQHLWREGLDYMHGTGHGVGSHLCVHEGPAGIGARLAFNDVALAPGMVLSNEPGYYEDGEYGIRIENVVIVKEVIESGYAGKPYYGFEHVTMVPMSRPLIDTSLLTKGELEWLNSYHQEVHDKTKDFFKDDALAMEWLKRETAEFK